MVSVPDLSLQTAGWAGEVWGLAWLLTMHTSSPGATITGPGPAIQETLALTIQREERGERGKVNANKPRHFSKTKHSNGNKTLETAAKETKHVLY